MQTGTNKQWRHPVSMMPDDSSIVVTYNESVSGFTAYKCAKDSPFGCTQRISACAWTMPFLIMTQPCQSGT